MPHSDACFVKAYSTEDTETFLDRAYLAAFAFLGGVPQSILYDNIRIVVAKIFGKHETVPMLESCSEFLKLLSSGYLFP